MDGYETGGGINYSGANRLNKMLGLTAGIKRRGVGALEKHPVLPVTS